MISGDALVERHVEDHGPGLAMLPWDGVRRTALRIAQPRAAVLRDGSDPVLEAIAGRLDLDLAPNGLVDRTGRGGGCDTEHEDGIVYELALGQLAEDPETGRLTDARTLVPVRALRRRQPGLFA